MKKFLMFFLLVASIAHAQAPIATTTVYGITASGSAVPVAVESDGRMKVNRLGTYSDGSNEVSAKVDSDNYVYVNMAKDTRFTATKTTSNAVAASSAVSITPIANVKRVTIILNEIGKEVWVKIGAADAGIDSGIKVLGGLVIDDVATDTVISYYASESTKIAIVQE